MNTSSRRSGVRPATALLAGLALAAGLTACGSDGGDDTATDPAASSSSASDTPSETPAETPSGTPSDELIETIPESGSGSSGTIPAVGSAGVTEATMVSGTEGGGSASTMALALDTDRAVSEFVAGLEGALRQTVTSTVTQVAEQSPDATPYGAVVSIGCDAPTGVSVDAGEAGFQVVPQLPKSNVQCLAPITYVVVFAAPDA